MQRGLYVPPFGTFGDANFVVELARRAEDAGWDGFFLWDHLLFEDGAPFVDAWIALSAIAATTTAILLGPLVTPLARRRPWKLAREAVTLDHLSNGRLILGLGLGTDYWREFSAFDEPATTDRSRADLVDEGIDILRGLWTGDHFDYQGRRLRVHNAQFLPRPLQEPGIPIWTAGLLPLRTGPLERAARADGIMPVKMGGPVTPGDIRKLASEIGHRRESGAEFAICAVADARQAGEFEQAGTTWLLQSLPSGLSVEQARNLIDRGPAR